ncbi:MAG: peptide chain release factor N(5)-glutamine methyltransferase [Pseudomonadota bacterium]|nr:peptide chain release factor N(5)-glutamine methyltransferase [Pseudomonadota bacterium]
MTRAHEAEAALRDQLAAGSSSAALDAALLLAHVLGLSRAALAARPELELTAAQAVRLGQLAVRRAVGEPLAYLTGRREFWSLELDVTPDVLVPRPETELLVEWALEALVGRPHPAVLDLGTGSGAIALAIARERPDATVTAVDISEPALAVARGNAGRLALANLQFLAGNWFEPVAAARFDVIVSNPPYIAAGDPALGELAHEPRVALVAGDDGLRALETICAGAGSRLASGGCLLVEHGATQGEQVRAGMAKSGFTGIESRRDLAGRERATRGNSAR